MPQAILEDTGCAAVMIARGAIGHPWIFTQARAVLAGEDPPPDPSMSVRLGIALCQAQMLADQFGEHIAAHEMRAHLAWYSKGMPGGVRLRIECNTSRTLGELAEVFRRWGATHP